MSEDTRCSKIPKGKKKRLYSLSFFLSRSLGKWLFRTSLQKMGHPFLIMNKGWSCGFLGQQGKDDGMPI